jgi:hypothetical protein
MVAALKLVESSMWFELTPMPDDIFEITVKPDGYDRLRKILDEVL